MLQSDHRRRVLAKANKAIRLARKIIAHSDKVGMGAATGVS